MCQRRLMSRWVLWAAVGVLMLRAAMPLLATAAAQLRGVPVGEVCDVYGVNLPTASEGVHSGHAHHLAGLAGHGGHAGHGSNPSSPHSEERCALTALGTLASPCVALAVNVHASAEVAGTAPSVPTQFHDACATWVARLKQGPPDLS